MAPTCGTIIVEPAFDPSAVSATCDVNTTTITAGGAVTINATVTNNNDAPGQYDLTITAGDALNETFSGSVDGNSSSDESITIELPQTGDYPVSVSVEASRA